MAQNTYLSERDPEWAAIEHLYPKATAIDSVIDYREMITVIRAQIDATKEKVTEGLRAVETSIPVENGEILVKAFIPLASTEAEKKDFPLLFYIYGGGFILGSIDNEEAFLRRLAVNSRITCVCADQRKAPEYPYPIPVDDCQAALKWALDNSAELSINKSGVIVGGMSSGANIATVLAHRSLKDPDLNGKISGQLLSLPMVISPHAYPQAEKFKSDLLSLDKDEDGRFVIKQHLCAFTEAYHGKDNAANPEVSPLLADTFEGLPPAYIQVAGLDILRDEGILYESLLRKAGVPTKLDAYPGLPHGFYVSLKIKATEKQNKDLIAGLDWLLHRSN